MLYRLYYCKNINNMSMLFYILMVGWPIIHNMIGGNTINRQMTHKMAVNVTFEYDVLIYYLLISVKDGVMRLGSLIR